MDDSQSFSAIWAARAAERACVACCVLQRATAPLVEAGVPAALVYALRCAVETSDARAQPKLYAATIVALLDFDNFPREEPDEETGFRGIDEASRLEISNQLVQAGFLQVVSTVATTRGEETSDLRCNVFYGFTKLTLLSWPTLYSLPAALVANLLELVAASIPNPDAENALTALHRIVRTHGESDAHSYDGPEFKFPLATLVGLVAPRGLSILADVIKCGAAGSACELLTDLARCDFQQEERALGVLQRHRRVADYRHPPGHHWLRRRGHPRVSGAQAESRHVQALSLRVCRRVHREA